MNWFYKPPSQFHLLGEVQNGLLVDPNQGMAYYPLGSSIVALPLRGGQKSFLTGHTYLIGTIAISNSGRYLASGETDNVGTKVCYQKRIPYRLCIFLLNTLVDKIN